MTVYARCDGEGSHSDEITHSDEVTHSDEGSISDAATPHPGTTAERRGLGTDVASTTG
jgi:hypothetical protein